MAGPLCATDVRRSVMFRYSMLGAALASHCAGLSPCPYGHRLGLP
ncbi:hypothetical protein [Streptomyces sp. NPDC005969]